MREKAAIAIPHSSSRRRKVASARIDAILYALIKESLRGAEELEDQCCGRDEGGEGAAPRSLRNNDMEEVIAYVDRDGSGDIHVAVRVGCWLGAPGCEAGCCS